MKEKEAFDCQVIDIVYSLGKTNNFDNIINSRIKCYLFYSSFKFQTGFFKL